MHFIKFAFSGLLLICLFSIYSCREPEYLSESDLSQFISNNPELSKSVTSNGIQIRATFKPTDLLVAQEIKRKENFTSEEIEATRSKYSKHYYFVLSFSHDGKELLSPSSLSAARFSELLQTMSFRMSEVVRLTTAKKDTIPVSDYVYNRTFGMSKSTDLLFVFDKSKAKDQEWIRINLEEFGLGLGKQTIQFDIRDLENTPRIFKPKH